VLSIEDIEPPIAFIRLSTILCINIFNKMNTPNMTAKDIGTGNKIEIVRLIPKDIPRQTNWLSRNCLLLLILILDSHSLILLLYSYYKNHPNSLQLCSVDRRSLAISFWLVQNGLIPLDDSI
jgi:hypothetical protein